MPIHEGIRFEVKLSLHQNGTQGDEKETERGVDAIRSVDKRVLVSIPSLRSAPITVAQSANWHWPILLPVGPILGPRFTIVWATTRIIARLSTRHETIVVLVKERGVEAEVAISLPEAARISSVAPNVTLSREMYGDLNRTAHVLRVQESTLEHYWRQVPMVSIDADLHDNGNDKHVFRIVCLPARYVGSVWRDEYMKTERVIISEPNQERKKIPRNEPSAASIDEATEPSLIMADGKDGIAIRSTEKQVKMAIYPPLTDALAGKRLVLTHTIDAVKTSIRRYHAPLFNNTAARNEESDGPFFDLYSIPMPAHHPAPVASVWPIRTAGPPRDLVIVKGSGKPCEPNATDWESAAEWGIRVQPPTNDSEVALRVRHRYLSIDLRLLTLTLA